MKKIRAILVGTVVGVLAGGSALSGEILGDLPEAYSSDFEWDGVYVGVGASIDAYTNGIISGNTAYLDFIVGANVTSGDFLFGAEAWVGGYNDIGNATGVQAGGEVRAGMLVGGGALIYSAVGLQAFDFGGVDATIGVGTEFVVSDEMTIDIEYKYLSSLNSAYVAHQIGASLNWYF